MTLKITLNSAVGKTFISLTFNRGTFAYYVKTGNIKHLSVKLSPFDFVLFKFSVLFIYH